MSILNAINASKKTVSVEGIKIYHNDLFVKTSSKKKFEVSELIDWLIIANNRRAELDECIANMAKLIDEASAE